MTDVRPGQLWLWKSSRSCARVLLFIIQRPGFSLEENGWRCLSSWFASGVTSGFFEIWYDWEISSNATLISDCPEGAKR